MAILLPLMSLLFLSFTFDTQEVIESQLYPPLPVDDPPVKKNISDTLSAYDSFCVIHRLEPLKRYTAQIKAGRVKVNLPGEGLFGQDLEAVLFSLRINNTVQHLDLSRNFFGDGAAKSLAVLLEVNPALKTVFLTQCVIGPEGCAELTAQTNQRRMLVGLEAAPPEKTTLLCYLNACWKAEEQPLREWVLYCSVDPKTLRLPYLTNAGRDLSAGVLNEILASPRIERLQLDGVRTEAFDWDGILKHASSNPSIEEIAMTGGNFPESFFDSFVVYYGEKTALKRFSVEKVELSDASMGRITSYLDHTDSLERFIFRDNTVSPVSFLSMMKSLYWKNRSIRDLRLRGYAGDDEGYLELLKRKFPERPLAQPQEPPSR